MTALARQGISKESYLRLTGKDEETMAREAEPSAAAALKREAVLVAVVEAEGIEPSDDEVREALVPTAERAGRPVEEVFDQLREADRLERVREEVAHRKALELLVSEAKPISVDQAMARENLWTPEKEATSAGQLWTPGSD
jgi:trigger factor